MLNKIPSYTNKILNLLNESGYEAYLVGGAVRDLLLGREPGDYDITTNAKPEVVRDLALTQGWKVVDNLGQNFGCCVVVVDGIPTEVTTFRGEKYGEDAHKPEDVWYCKTLKEDLSRRDFTVNAMAMDAKGNIYDYFGGQEDLANKLLRTVGNAASRYEEDALRMFRACRFVAQLGFTYVEDNPSIGGFGMENTPYYLEKNYKFPVERTKGLSLERIRKELDKMLVAPYASKGLMLFMGTGLADAKCRVKENGNFEEIDILPELRHLVGLKQNPRFHCYDTWEHTLFAIDNSPRELLIRWALLLHDLGKGQDGIRTITDEGQPRDAGHEKRSAEDAVKIFARLRMNKDLAKLATWLVAEHMRFVGLFKIEGNAALLRWLRAEAHSGMFHNNEEMVFAFDKLTYVYLADMGATHAGFNKELMTKARELSAKLMELAREMPVANSDLNISGKEMLEFISKDRIKEAFVYLLERVQNGNLPNSNAELREALQKHSAKAQK
ncbi:MAG: HD domain-containing protein [Phascolarctobacterium sp.]|nr:HD domain-containing protein [Phascolarctobacterium sp.]